MGINNDEADFLASLVKVERGKQWSIKDCLYGNEEKDRSPNIELINEINRLEQAYTTEDFIPHLKETIESIDGLVSGLSMHASGVYIFKDGYINQNSKMKTPRGDEVTAWSMADSDYCGGLKYDSLTTECQDKLEVCVDYLLKFGKIKWQGSNRATYNKYLHPDVLDYTNSEMWDSCSNGEIIDLFQFITPVGGACIKKIKPHSLVEMMNANSLMRISVKDGEQPIDKFLRYKQDIGLWYEELESYGIYDEDEIATLEKILLPNYGVANTQEDIMELVMEEKISGFTLMEANKMRKIVAKKKDEEVEGLRQKFYSHGRELKNSEGILDYVWEQCIKPQLAYSFSRNHVNPYSAEALQEMNLYHFYPNCYWNCATLSVNAGCVENDDEDAKTKSTEYGKIAKAIYRSKAFGVPVLPPSINKSQLNFTPIEEDNTIRFGLAGITGINQDIAKEIIEGRPYTSFKQFYDYHKNLQVCIGVDEDGQEVYRGSLITKSKMINLVKSGCFDEFNPNRIALMKWLCVYENPKKEKLTTANLKHAIELGVDLPKDLVRAFRFKQYVVRKEFLYCNDPNFKSKKHYILDPTFAYPYFEKRYMGKMQEDLDYYHNGQDWVVVDKSLEKAMKEDIDKLKQLLNDPFIVDDYNKKELRLKYSEMIDKEDVNRWSFESVCFYDKQHELAHLDLSPYNIVSFKDLPEEPLFTESKGKNGRIWKRYELSRICGTVLSRNDSSHLVDILTPEEEVITLKIPQGQYGFYKKTISETIGDKKTVIEDSWLKRGCHIMVCGYRNGESFYVKNYQNSLYQHSIMLITDIREDDLTLKIERYNPEKEIEY